MSLHGIISLAVAAVLGVACVSDAFAARAVRGGGIYHGNRGTVAWRGGAYRGGAYRGGYVGRGVGAAAVGAAAVGAGAAAHYYNGRPQCGYYPYPPCY
jgi:hypothetical protein